MRATIARRSLALLGAVWLLAGCGEQQDASGGAADERTVRVLSFNIRFGTADDGDDAWPHRESLVYDVIRRCDCDFVGLQEALRFQLDGIRDAVTGYAEIGVGRDDGRQAGEYSAILYRSARWEVTENGTFWLSATPEVPGSATWGNRYPRVVTWGRFVDRENGAAVRVFNTHFDHESQPSREQSAALLASRIAGRAGDDPVIVTGDFNAGEDNPAILHLAAARDGAPALLADSFRMLHPEASAVGTFHGFAGRRNGDKIDYVFVEPGTGVQRAAIIDDNENGRFPSDHFPVYAEIRLPQD